MQQLGIHQKKLVALIEALLAFIALLLPWTKYKVQAFNMFDFGGGGMGISPDNGFRSWGWLVIIGIVGVIACTLLENRARDYSYQMKLGAMGGFGVIILGAIIYLIALNSQGALQTQDGTPVKVGAGIGLWMALAAGIIGLAWVSGIISKLSTASANTTSSVPPSIPPVSSSAPPPPPPPSNPA